MKKILGIILFIFVLMESGNTFASEYDSKSLVTTWKVYNSNQDIVLPLNGEVNVTIDWGDGSSIETVTQKFPVHEYKNIGEYDVIIKGNVEEFGYFSDSTQTAKSSYYLIQIKQWGDVGATRYGFFNCTGLKRVESIESDVYAFKNVESTSEMFYGCESLAFVDLTKIDVSNVTDMSYMFYECGDWNLYRVDLSNWNVSNVIDMSYMFYNCYASADIYLNNWDFSNVENLSYMFYRALNAKVSIESINLKNATDMSYMFYNASGIEELVLKSDKTINVNMLQTFYGCKRLTTLNLSGLKVKPTNLKNAFYDCNAVTELNLSGFDVSATEDMSYMFYNCNALKSINLSSFDASQVTNASYMFYECNSLQNIELIGFKENKITDISYMFYNCNALKYLDLSDFNASNVENFKYVFYGCESLENIYFDAFDTSKATDMSYMFSGCISLDSLELLDFNTENVIYMNRMFEKCEYLRELDLTSFDTSNVVDMSFMFGGCKILNELDLTSFNTANVKNMTGMFSGCSSLEGINLVSFNVENVTNLGSMFLDCESLVELNGFKNNVKVARNTGRMFKNCKKLTSINFENMDVSNVVYMTEMFLGCESLTNFDFSTWNTSNVIYMDKMFYGCTFENIDISNFDTSNVEDMESMFGECNKLKEIDLSMLDTSHLKNARYLISGKKLEKINLSNWNLENCYHLSIFTNANELKINEMFIGEKVEIDFDIADGIIDARGIKCSQDMDFSDSFNYSSASLIIIEQNINNLLESVFSKFDFEGVLIVSKELNEDNVPKLLKTDNKGAKLYLLNQELADLYKTLKGYKETFGEENILPLTYLNNSEELYIEQGCHNTGKLEDGFFIANLKLDIYYAESDDTTYIEKAREEIKRANEILSLIGMKLEIDKVPVYTDEISEDVITYKVTELESNDVTTYQKKIIICGTIPLEKNIISYNYNGNEQIPTLEEIIEDYKEYYKTLIDFECTPRINAGEYEFTISLKDKEHYEFIVYNHDTNRYEITSEEQKISWNIQKIKIDVPDVKNMTYYYTGEEVCVIDEYDSTNITISGEKATNAGKYNLNMILRDKINYMWDTGNSEDIVIEWNIRKIKVNIPYVKSNAQYNGEEQSAILKNFDKETMLISGEKATDVGEYTATISLKDKTNYQWTNGTTDDITLNWKITQKILIKPDVMNNSGPDVNRYTGKEQQPIIEEFDEELMNITGNVAIDVGTYTAVVSIKDKTKYKWEDGSTEDVVLKWQIKQSSCEITVVNRNLKLGEELKILITPNLTDGEYVVLYEKKNDNGVYNDAQLPTEPGLYKIEIQVFGDKNLWDTTRQEYILITENSTTSSTTTTTTSSSKGGGSSSSAKTYNATITQTKGGTIAVDNSNVKKGDTQMFVIIPDEGYKIVDVKIDGESVGAVDTYTIKNVTKKHEIVATFEKITEEIKEQEESKDITWANNFNDVNANDWYYEAVKFVNEEGLFKGLSDTEFGANITMNRAMIVTVLHRLARETEVENSHISFSDISNEEYYTKAVIWAVENGIVNGVGNNEFAPQDNVTREQLIVMLYRYAKLNGKLAEKQGNLSFYDDVNLISDYAKEAFSWAIEEGIITGRTTTTLAPQGIATRAEVATMIMRFSNTLSK